LVSTPSSNERGVDTKPSSLFAYQFPFYLSYGMTYSQFWEEDSCLATYYREAHEISNRQHNQEMWVQGMYFLEAIGSIMDKNHKYPDKPYALTQEEKEEREEQERVERAYAFMKAFTQGNNKNIKEGVNSG